MSKENTISIQSVGLGKSYRKSESEEPFFALQNISFELKRGEVLGIIGQNGSGKSTLLRILSGITKPTEGYVDVYGSVASILDIGTGIHPDLTGRQNIYLRGQLLGMKRQDIDAVYNQLVDFSGIADFMDSPVKHYSSGMFLRLAFSIIVHLDYDILLLDEVLAVGDESFRRKCAEKIETIVSSGKTVVLVSHDLRSVMSLCTRAILLQSGEIQAIDTPLNVVRDSYLAQMAGMDPAGELIEGEVEIDKMSSEELGFQVLGFRMYDSENSNSDTFLTNRDVYIELNYRITKENVQLAISITDFLSNRLIDDSPIVTLERNNESFVGDFSVTWTLKSELFNAGQYYIGIYAINDELNTIKRFERVRSFTYTPSANMENSRYDVLRAAFSINLNMKVNRM